MHIEFLVEEPSTEVCLRNIVPRIIGGQHTFAIHPHQGKLDLLGSLAGRLRGYARWLPQGWRIVVLVDADQQDCRVLKNQLVTAARTAGLTVKAAGVPRDRIQVLGRLAVQELEAWFFGDPAALRTAFPKLPSTLAQSVKYRAPDSISNAWEALERELQRAGYFRTGIQKITAARRVSEHMDPARNTSRSFRVFRQGLLALLS